MEKLIVLGTGNAQATHCYNTCFALQEGREYFLVDAGGGNGILRALETAHIPLEQIHHLFVTHAHNDHILGVVWIIRMIASSINKEEYEGDLMIYCHRELGEAIQTICGLTLGKKFCRHFGKRIRFHIIEDGETSQILGDNFTFFDIRSTKAKQFGFSLKTRQESHILFAGDEPCQEHLYPYLENSDWLFHEAFCLYEQRERFRPYEKHHSTVKDVCQLAERFHIPNLILWHTEDKNLSHRRELYTREGQAYYHGHLIVPEDGEVIPLSV